MPIPTEPPKFPPHLAPPPGFSLDPQEADVEDGDVVSIEASRAKVTRQYKVSGDKVLEENESDDLLGIHLFVTTPAMVSAKIGRTINLGDFESLRMDVMVSLPCYKEEVEAAQVVSARLAARFLQKELEDAGAVDPVKKKSSR